MKFVLASGWDEGIADLAQRLVTELAAGKKVLWLLSGGSNIQASVEVMEKVTPQLSRSLSISLTDERYGEPGHADSNWQQLMDDGFKPKEAKLLPVLQAGLDLSTTAKSFEQSIKKAFDDNDIVVAQFGIGTDGHTAGILPGSPAAKEKVAWVAAYEASPYQRITMTFQAICQVDHAFTFAFGSEKLPALQKLYEHEVDTAEQPAQILKQIKDSYLFSDQVGEA